MWQISKHAIFVAFGNAVYASATTERTDVLSVKGIRPMFPNPYQPIASKLATPASVWERRY